MAEQGRAGQSTRKGAPYQRIPAVAPNSPVVPAGAPAALTLPIVEIRGGQKEESEAGSGVA